MCAKVVLPNDGGQNVVAKLRLPKYVCVKVFVSKYVGQHLFTLELNMPETIEFNMPESIEFNK
jgi:hypothetical protein